MKSRVRAIVALVALVSAAGVASWHYFSDRRAGAGSWSASGAPDRAAALESPLVRHAMWMPPVGLAGEVNTPAEESRATLSPDGSTLVFAVGARGSNAELWIADARGDRFDNARPLSTIDTASDELAPAFGRDALYFASDRPGGTGGLDLYRASYTDGRFGEAERMPTSLQSSRDDTDPAPSPRSGDVSSEIVFSSARDGAFHLFAATSDAGGGWSVQKLDALCSTAADVEPAFDPDGRFLWFASQRDGSFDLFRAPRRGDGVGAEGFGKVEKLDELSTTADERAPMPVAHGFEVLFARPGPGGALDLCRAHSVELARIQPGAWSWLELATLAGLVLLAVLAFLSDRWPALDTLYKCYLVSLLVHLLLLCWFHRVHVESKPVPREPGGKVRIHLDGRDRGLTDARVERAGDVSALASKPAPSSAAVSRATLGAADGPLAQPASLPVGELRPSEGAAPEAPGRASAPIARGSAITSSDVSDKEAIRASSSKPAPALALQVAAEARGPIDTRTAGGGPARAELAVANGNAPRATEGGRRIDVSHAVSLDAPPMGRDEGVVARASGTAPAADALSDREVRTAVKSQAAPGLALEARSFAGETGTQSGGGGSGPARADMQGATAAAAPGKAEGRAIDVSSQVALDAPSLPRAGGGPPARTNGGGGNDALADREAVSGSKSPSQPAPGLALEARSFAGDPALQSNGGGGGGSGPARADLPGAPEGRGPERAEGRAIDVASRPNLDAPSLPRPSDGPPSRGGGTGGADKLVDREAVVARGTSTGRPGADLLDGLADAAASNGSRSGPPSGGELGSQGPVRAQLQHPTDDALIEAPARLEIPIAKSTDAPPPAPDRNTWSGTPYENRSGAAKERALRDHGGTAETEQAVERGLAYLAKIQGKRGNWGPLDVPDDKYGRVCVGKTALATLAFLGAGHTHVSNTQHSAVVARALSFLISAQDPESGHFGDSEAYSHGIATYALAEAYALTRDPELESALRPAIAHILAHQSHSSDPRNAGGWSYYYADDRVYDRWSRTSITAWQVMALESARLGGLEVPESVFAQAAQFLEGSRDEEKGWYWYNQDPSRMNSGYPTLPASTPAALFVLSILGRDITSHEFDVPRAFVVDRSPKGFRFTGEDDFVERGQGNPYFWYYGTLATFRAGGGAWSTWNEAMKKTLLPAQAADGSWNPIDVYARYARDDARDKSYTTALSVLSLEVYYRYYLPLLKVR